MLPLVAYILLFLSISSGFILIHLLIGKLIRPNRSSLEKESIYECGEPTIGSPWIQFDLRFYVVALLFVVFDVEVAVFFPWAVVFGKANQVVATPLPGTASEFQAYQEQVNEMLPEHLKDCGRPDDISEQWTRNHDRASLIARIAFVEGLAFFAVLLVGFAYLWRRGDLEWVRSTISERPGNLPMTNSTLGIDSKAGLPSISLKG